MCAGYMALALFFFFSFQCILTVTNLTEKDFLGNFLFSDIFVQILISFSLGRGRSPSFADVLQCLPNTYDLCCSPLKAPAFLRSTHILGEGKGYCDWQ